MKVETSKNGAAKTTRKKSARLGDPNSPQANRRAAVVLEVLAGVRSPSQAAEALQLSVNYYYVLERKALRGLVAACQPAPKGPPGPTAEARIGQLQCQLERCQQECQRQAALVRATQRAIGLPATTKKPESKKGDNKGRPRRRRRPTVRAMQAVGELQKNSSLENAAEGLETSVPPSSQGEPVHPKEPSDVTSRQKATSRSAR